MAEAAKRSEAPTGIVIEADTILPEQYFERIGSEHSAFPEKRLMLAVLEDAVATFQRYVDARNRRGQRLFREAEEWVLSDDTEWPFAFENICHTLDIEPDFLRRGLARWKERQLSRAVGNGARVYRFPFRRVNGSRHSITVRSEGMRKSA
ncbi:MAG: hypothetical protein ACREQJ_00755 [Candidatus Binatia bacterium]